jgi:ribonuclease BN (tRNA processing enzyme)
MKIHFIGVGTQFSSHDQYHSNMVITAPSGKKMLVDCGGDARFSLAESGIYPTDLDAVYISHLHSDHIGGMEWLAISTYFGHESKRLKLFGEENLLSKLWNSSLKGGLECIGWKRTQLTDYFDCYPMKEGTPFRWEGIRFDMLKMLHVAGNSCNHYSYGLLIETNGIGTNVVFITTDTLFQPELIVGISEQANLIFHDCETIDVRTTVHAHYDQLCTMPDAVKQKIWLYHYQPNPAYKPLEDGFQGFVVKGQEFSFPV